MPNNFETMIYRDGISNKENVAEKNRSQKIIDAKSFSLFRINEKKLFIKYTA